MIFWLLVSEFWSNVNSISVLAVTTEPIQLFGAGFGLSAKDYQCRFSVPPSGEPAVSVNVTDVRWDRVLCAPPLWIFSSASPVNLTLVHGNKTVEKRGEPINFYFQGESLRPFQRSSMNLHWG
jgi:hypothetical protein